MRSLRVLPVGNGACAVVRQGRDYISASKDLVSIIDCGRGSRGGRIAAAYLEAELSSRDWDALQSLVVTHWDGDHWNGLRHFADTTPRSSSTVKRNLKLYSPAIPIGISPRLPAGIAALISATSVSGIEANDFTDAWKKHFDVETIPVSQGDTIELAGRLYKVEWPPRRVSGTVVSDAASILEQIDEIADSDPVFRDLLLKAYSRVDDGAFQPANAGDNGGQEETANSFDNSSFEIMPPDTLIDPSDSEEAFEETGENCSLDVELMERPRFASEKYGALIRAARRLQNDLSLVFHDDEFQSLIVYGDAPTRVVRTLIPRLHKDYLVQLAPHHGTHPMPPNSPRSVFCIAQCDQHQKRAWLRHKRDTRFDLAVCDFEPEGIQLPLDCWPWWR